MGPRDPSRSIKAIVVHHHGCASEFIRKLKGFLGDDSGFQDSEPLRFQKTISSAINVLPNHKLSFRKKRSPRINVSLLDVSRLDGPLTADVLSAAINLYVLQDHNFSPQISFKKLVTVSKISPEKRRKRCLFEALAEGEKREQKKSKRNLDSLPQVANPELPMDFKLCIRELTGLVEVVFVYEKKLFRTDVNSGQNRFLIPRKQVKNGFLTEKEMEILKADDPITGKGTIEALLIEPSLDKCKINLRKWDMGGKNSGKVSENFVLVTTWNNVVKDNNLDEGMTVQLWSFRRGEELCFALVNRG